MDESGWCIILKNGVGEAGLLVHTREPSLVVIVMNLSQQYRLSRSRKDHRWNRQSLQILPGWVHRSALQRLIGSPPSTDTPGWGLAYRLNPATGEVETEWWQW
ncbi:MAG: hypothetical protein C7B45_05700 [Sulfobacillus acidophilus]|uniref:Uncharacterized protein n=1 Tax=Sulfobacillus acidophilus TaxID=53633 RepID=A0A2T2WKB8_9FIRM|nr:MAG: hypothetical protein C7B45_05700 [Sulfobacillus acidophilus]